MGNKKEKCRVSTEDINLNDETLGRFIEGYDSKKDRNGSNGCTVGLGSFFLVVGLLMGYFFFKELFSSPTFHNNIFIFLVCSVFLLLLGGVLVYGIASVWANPHRVYVYEKGFVWKVVNRKGKEKSATQVLFDAVDSIAFAKTRNYTNGAYTGTSFNFRVLDLNGKELLRKKGSYRNKNEEADAGSWLYFSLEAIEQQWAKIALERLNKQLEERGELMFKNDKGRRILLTRQGVSMDEANIPWEYVSTNMHDGYLWINDSRKKKGLFSSSDIKINVNTMPNSRLFLAAFRFLDPKSGVINGSYKRE